VAFIQFYIKHESRSALAWEESRVENNLCGHDCIPDYFHDKRWSYKNCFPNHNIKKFLYRRKIALKYSKGLESD